MGGLCSQCLHWGVVALLLLGLAFLSAGWQSGMPLWGWRGSGPLIVPIQADLHLKMFCQFQIHVCIKILVVSMCPACARQCFAEDDLEITAHYDKQQPVQKYCTPHKKAWPGRARAVLLIW